VRAVVTGAGGYLGAAIAEALRAADVEVVELRRSGADGPDVRVCGLDDPAGLKALLGELKPDAVVNAAGRVRGTPFELFRDNAATACALADAVLAASPEAVLTQIGSAAEYGAPGTLTPIKESDTPRPTGVYGWSKLAATGYLGALAQTRGLRWNLVRLFNPIGAPLSPQQVLGAFVEKASAAWDAPEPRVVRMGRLDAIRDVVAVDDFTRLIVRLVVGQTTGVVVNACSGVGSRTRDLVDRLNALSGRRFVVEEQGPAPDPATLDAAIGDAERFLRLADLEASTPAETVLAHAWDGMLHRSKLNPDARAATERATPSSFKETSCSRPSRRPPRPAANA